MGVVTNKARRLDDHDPIRSVERAGAGEFKYDSGVGYSLWRHSL